jgi:glyoxylase-like metal-dependent hydrolase (beta-lactamase superfamily II)
MMSEIIQIEVSDMQNFCYMIKKGSDFIVIDPSYGYKKIKEIVGNGKILAVLLTHGHFDHVNDVPLIVKDFKTDVYIHRDDIRYLPFSVETKDIKDGDIIDFGFNIKVMHTPGHTPGSVCYIFEKNIFSGDTLFAGYCGRVDLPGSDALKMRESLIRISKLNDDMVIFPGHNYNLSKTTIGYEKKNNPFLKSAQNKDEFLSIVL